MNQISNAVTSEVRSATTLGPIVSGNRAPLQAYSHNVIFLLSEIAMPSLSPYGRTERFCR